LFILSSITVTLKVTNPSAGNAPTVVALEGVRSTGGIAAVVIIIDVS